MAVIIILIAQFVGVAPVARFLVAELCPQSCRSKIAGVGWMGKWALATVYTLCFPLLMKQISNWVFSICAVSCFAFFLWFWWYLPETKQRSVDAIVADLGKGRIRDGFTLPWKRGKSDDRQPLTNQKQNGTSYRSLEKAQVF